MGLLRTLLDKLEFKEEDSFKKSCLKGMAEGMLDGLVVIGALELVYIAVDAIEKK